MISGAAMIGEAMRKMRKMVVKVEELIMMISYSCKLVMTSTGNISAEDFIPEARWEGISANNPHNDFNHNLDESHTVSKFA